VPVKATKQEILGGGLFAESIDTIIGHIAK